jgi:site-specific recombinase XerD
MSFTIVSIQQLIQDFFEKHLTIERYASRNTVLAYRDALRLFLSYAAQRFECTADQLDHQILDVDIVRSFLGWLEKERKCSARTRNHRLAALKTFVRYVAFAAPEHAERCRRIRELSSARFEQPEVEYLEDEEVRGLVKAATERRDRALLLLMYNTGARVQEIIDLDVCDLRLDPVPVVMLEGKGRKQRTNPLLDRTVDSLRQWLAERGDAEGPLFLNAQGRRLSRSGVAYILRKLAEHAGLVPQHAARVTPHVIRHTTAMHLLRSEVDITTIAAWLGHSQLTTTHGYVEIDLRMKQKALAATTALPDLTEGKYPEGKLLAWLAGLGRSRRYAESPPPMPAASLKKNRQLHIIRRCT